MDKKAHPGRLHVGDIVTGYDGALHGHFRGPIIKYERVPTVRKNLPDMWLATVEVNEFGSTITFNFDKFNEAYA